MRLTLFFALIAVALCNELASAQNDPPLVTRKYDVSDLTDPADETASTIKNPSVDATFTSLKHRVVPRTETDLREFLEVCVQPKSWVPCGGRGTIWYSPSARTFTIRQTESAHEDIEELLRAQRDLRRVQVQVELCVIKVPIDFFAKDGIKFSGTSLKWDRVARHYHGLALELDFAKPGSIPREPWSSTGPPVPTEWAPDGNALLDADLVSQLVKLTHRDGSSPPTEKQRLPNGAESRFSTESVDPKHQLIVNAFTNRGDEVEVNLIRPRLESEPKDWTRRCFIPNGATAMVRGWELNKDREKESGLVLFLVTPRIVRDH